LINASNFGGWENMARFERHVGFVKDHHRKVGRIAVITGHDWQGKALQWITG
jgi:hypothetical protein